MALAFKEHAAAPAYRPALLGLELLPEGAGAQGRLGRSGRLIMSLSLILVDAVAAQIAFYFGAELYSAAFGEGTISFGFGPELAAMALMLPIGYALLDVYRFHGQTPIERFPSRIKATCLLFTLLVGWHYASQRILWPAGAAALTFSFAIVMPLIGESIIRSILIRYKLWGVPAVVIGAGPTGQRVVRILQQMPELGLRPVGFFDDHKASNEEGRAALVENLPVLGSIADSVKYSRRIETAIVTTPADAQERVDALATQLGYRDIIVVPDLRELPTLWVRTRDLNGLIGLQMRRNLLLRRNRLLKRTMDRLIALPLAIVCAPVIAVLSLWIMAVSRGSPFYVQIRAGKDGRPIQVWKLRTMYPDAEQQLERYLSSNPSARLEWQRYFKLTHDPRILPGVGHFLRRTSLDELPQLFNVIRGDMSLVGPRPLPKSELDESFDASFQSLRASVLPGISGLWQVSARSDGDQQVQQALDTYYIRNWSIWIDFYILSRTLGAVIAGRGAR
jgi:Undecaprenyl-phosphate galactose phosphotransferase WbaP